MNEERARNWNFFEHLRENIFKKWRTVKENASLIRLHFAATSCFDRSSVFGFGAMRLADMIRVQNLVKIFGTKRAVDGVSFSVERGEVLGFLGPNGAGTSTTMRMLTGF